MPIIPQGLALFVLLGAFQAQAHDQAATANAALKYWQAFALMPALDGQEAKRIGAWERFPRDESRQRLIDASKESRLYLLRGSKIPSCDWNLDYEDGIELLLPHLGKAVDLARLTALHGRSEFEQGHWEAGVEDAQAIFTLARHVGSDPITISILVSYLIDDIAIDLITPFLPELREAAPKILKAYDALPPRATFAMAYRTMEKQHTVQWLIDQLKAAEARQKGSWQSLWKKFIKPEGKPDHTNQPETFEEATKTLEALLPLCDRLAELAMLPHDLFQEKYPPFQQRVKHVYPLARHLLTTLETVLASQDRHQARLAMLRAAIAVVLDGPESLKRQPDPFGDGPFIYEPKNPGFMLQSKLRYEDKPVTLTVGNVPSEKK